MSSATAVLPLSPAKGPTPVDDQPFAGGGAAVGFDLRLLESFVVLASELHFGRAAQVLAFAQPALSQQIRRLETQLGSVLFTRDSRKVELTDAGRAFLAHARISLAAAVDGHAAVAALRRATVGRLPLSMDGDALDYVRELLQAFCAAHGDVHLDVASRFQDESREALARHTVDASILWSGHRPPRGFERTAALVGVTRAGIALRASHPLATAPEVTLDRLDAQRLVMFPRESASDLYDLVIDFLGGAAHFASVHHITTIGQGTGPDMLASLDDASVTPSPRWSESRQPPNGFVWKPLVPALPASLWLVWTGVASRPARALATFTANRAMAARRTQTGLTLVEAS